MTRATNQTKRTRSPTARRSAPRKAQGASRKSSEPILKVGRRVLAIEANALALLEKSLNKDFETAVKALYAVKGRVIVSGMGKNSHIGKKIAATLASTGTPAQFVHPGEASHGDLGMITSDDAVLLMSNSGESAELSDLIAHTKRFNIRLIGISSRAESTLIKACDIGLILPSAVEACPMGMAPTTSTTLTLALGDALAVALMELRRFSRDDYRNLHPGGSLGQALTRVSDLMHTDDAIPLVTKQTPMSEVVLTITSKSLGCAGVTDKQGRLIGIITDGDLARHMSDGLLDRKAEEIMTLMPKTLPPDALAAEAVAFMNNQPHPITCIFIVENARKSQSKQGAKPAPRKPLGILHMHDCLRAGIA